MTEMGAKRNGKSRPKADERLSRAGGVDADIRCSQIVQPRPTQRRLSWLRLIDPVLRRKQTLLASSRDRQLRAHAGLVGQI
jgi:hypothetical protein